MRKGPLILFLTGFLFSHGSGQCQTSDFPYRVELEEVKPAQWPALHSHALAVVDGRCLLIGGRRDGLHARQPFRSFPAGERNTRIYLLNLQTGNQHSADIESLPQQLREQLSSSNMNFIQRGNRLFLTGGYGFSETADDHVTFPQLTVVDIPMLIRQVENGRIDSLPFRTYRDERFAVTGGRMGWFADTLLLVAGHRFDGRYNPMGHATYVQAYTHEVRRFLFPSGTETPVFLPPLQDPLHLRRRDFNLFPYMDTYGIPGYTMASGVFQRGLELPYLYPVDIQGGQVNAITSFHQLLCNYHTAFAPMFDPISGTTHALFFGGLSEYHPDNGLLIRDEQVPFVNTISRLARTSEGQYREYLLPASMPVMTGAASEFIPDPAQPQTSNGLLLLGPSSPGRKRIGYLFGGIESTQSNPFNEDETDENTSASGRLFAVWLIPDTTQSDRFVGGENPYSFEAWLEDDGILSLRFDLDEAAEVKVLFSDIGGDASSEMDEGQKAAGHHEMRYRMRTEEGNTFEFVSLIFNKRSIVTRPIKGK